MAQAPQQSRGDQTKTDRRVRVIVADDHTILRSGLRSMLEGEPDIEVVAEAPDGETALEKVAELHPDVVTMDVSMPGMGGIAATRSIRDRYPDVRVIGLSMHTYDDMGEQMLAAGATAYLSKDGPLEDLLDAIRT